MQSFRIYIKRLSHIEEYNLCIYYINYLHIMMHPENIRPSMHTIIQLLSLFITLLLLSHLLDQISSRLLSYHPRTISTISHIRILLLSNKSVQRVLPMKIVWISKECLDTCLAHLSGNNTCKPHSFWSTESSYVYLFSPMCELS